MGKRKTDRLPPRNFKGKHPFLWDLKTNWVLWLMLVPIAAFFIINSYLPMVGIYFAFTDFNFIGGLFGSPFVGLKNFEFLFKSNVLWRLLRNTILYNIAFILIGNVAQIFIAILISQLTCKKFKKTTQTMIFMPYFVSMVVVGVVSYNLFNYENGLFNGIITGLGLEQIDFYTKKWLWPLIILFFNIWKGLGYGVVVYLATIMGIDPGLHEAAMVDGATVFQRIRYIVLPHLKPTFIILLIYALGGIVRGNFDLFHQLVGGNGQLYAVTDILDTYVYRSATETFDFGMGTAAGVFQSVIGLVIVMVVNWLIKRKNAEYAMF